MNAPIEWLLEGEPWVEYRTRVDLLEQAESDREVRSSRESMLDEPKIQGLLVELSGWPGTVISSHKSAGQPFHKLTFIADLGLKVTDPEVGKIIARILEHRSNEGPFQLPMNIPVQYGGMGRDQWAWALCDAPLIVYALIKLGLENAPEVQSAIHHLISLLRDNGWPCAVSKEIDPFRGPGRKADPCPFANLAMLKAFSASVQLHDSQASRIGAETLLALWDESMERHPYMFYMGTDFRKLKVPFVWYDLIHVLDVLSCLDWLHRDARLMDMVGVLKGKADPLGCYTAESIWTAWKGWEFAQKREPSRWLTLVAWRIIKRMQAV
ncbi:MAG: hypothetical protein A2W33_02865 [Chloroflexi bacterium RBG_16_52_11]|nr:MAG: hypothetical protein A2W33_02865 [Chloroflexi bacterium RBG_16_52_11]